MKFITAMLVMSALALSGAEPPILRNPYDTNTTMGADNYVGLRTIFDLTASGATITVSTSAPPYRRIYNIAITGSNSVATNIFVAAGNQTIRIVTNSPGYWTFYGPELSQSNYVTGAGLSGSNYVTSTQVGAQVAGSNYVTSAGLSGSNYVTSAQVGAQVAGSNYVTGSGLSGSNYVTGSGLSSSNYVTATQVGSQVAGSNYVTSAGLSGSNYVTGAGLSQSNYVTGTGLSQSNYVTGAGLSGSNYVTGAGLSGSNYVTGTGLSQSNYVTGTGLSGSNYVTGTGLSQSNYVTGPGLASSNYVTSTQVGAQVAGSNYVTTNLVSLYQTNATLASLGGQPSSTLLSNLTAGSAQKLTAITVNDAVLTNQPVTLSQLSGTIGIYKSYYFWSGSNSAVATNAKSMFDLGYGSSPLATNTVTVTTNGHYITYCSPAAGLTLLKAGTYFVYATAWRVGGDTLSLSAEIYIRSTNGTEVELTPVPGTSPQAVGLAATGFTFPLEISSNAVLSVTDSLEVKLKTSSVVSPPITLNISSGSLNSPLPSSQFVLVTEQVTTNTLTPTNMVSAYQTNATLSSLGGVTPAQVGAQVAGSNYVTAAGVPAAQTNATLSSLGGSTQAALNNVSNNLTTVSNTAASKLDRVGGSGTNITMTGTTTVTNLSTPDNPYAPSLPIKIKTGLGSFTGGNDPGTGRIDIETGEATDLQSGSVAIKTGQGIGSGSISLETGTTYGGNGGNIYLKTGDGGSGQGGSIYLWPGTTAGGGMVVISNGIALSLGGVSRTNWPSTNGFITSTDVPAAQTNATLASLGGATQAALNNVSNNLTTVSNTVTINATTNGYTSSSDKYGTNVVLTLNDGRLVRWTITNASNFAISTPAATNQTFSIRFEVTGTNTVTYATSNLLNSSALGCTNANGNAFMFDWIANGAKWQGYRLR
jgi:hypothetical protein